MKFFFRLVVLTLPIVTSQTLLAADDPARNVEQFVCKDVMRESSADRDVAIAFLHGFLLGKSGNSKFSTEALHKESRAFIERCLDNPAERVLDAMSKVKN